MKFLCCFNFPVGKLNEKVNKRAGFLLFETFEMCKCYKMRMNFSLFKKSETNSSNSIVEQKVISENTTSL